MKKVALALLIAAAMGCKGKEAAIPPQAQSTAPAATSPAAAAAEAPLTSTEAAVAPEVNAPGDIPDTQAFIKYASGAGGYAFDVPEGWARTEQGGDVTFVDKLDGLKMVITSASTAPTATTVRAHEAKQIQSRGRAVTIASVADVTLPGGKAVEIKYASNSDPNPVTNKRVRLENAAYIYFRNGKQAMLTLWAPQGADNVDQWNRMSKSFRWQ